MSYRQLPWHRVMVVVASTLVLALPIVAASCSSQPLPAGPSLTTTGGSTEARGGVPATAQCGPGGTTDKAAPFEFTASGGQVVTSVCVKSATEAFTLTASSACYAVTGIGTASASVTRVGPGPGCKEISYATFYAAQPTPTPTNTPTSGPTNTPTATNTPTDTPTPTNTPVPPTPTPTPTNTPPPGLRAR